MNHKNWLAYPLALLCISVYSRYDARAATITAASCSSSDVQAAVNSANTGDTVLVPGGSCTYTTAVNVPNTKAITLNGGGNTTITTSAQNAFKISAAASAATRITGFTINTSGVVNDSEPPIIVTGSTSTYPYRIDHITFNESDAGTFISVNGNGPGLIDHNTMLMACSGEMIHNLGLGATNNGGWLDSITPGSGSMLYIETNTAGVGNVTRSCNASGPPYYFYGTAFVQSYYGARTVVRYNSLTMVHIDQHGTAGMVGARWYEIYNNTFNVITNGSQSDYMHLRDGTGVVFNNSHPDTNNLAGAVGVNFDNDNTSGAWAIGYQVGAGIGAVSDGYATCSSGALNASPAYTWGNTDAQGSGGTMPVGSSSSYVVNGRDFLPVSSQPATMHRQQQSGDTCSTTYSYTPFTYPYPLDANGLPIAGSSQVPSPPTGLAAVVH